MGTMPKGTTDEVLRVIFPMANDIIMRENKDDHDKQ